MCKDPKGPAIYNTDALDIGWLYKEIKRRKYKLKKCPMCRAKGEVKVHRMGGWYEGQNEISVGCSICQISVGRTHTRFYRVDELVKKWNIRK